MNQEDVKNVLLEINPAVRRFFRNMIKFDTGVNPEKANGLSLQESKRFLKHAWVLSLRWSNQRTEYIDKSLAELTDFLDNFDPEDPIHNLEMFFKKLQKVGPRILRKIKTNRKKWLKIISSKEPTVLKVTRLLAFFHSVRIKTAALIMRLLCLDSNFFKADTESLIPPLDRVNRRMCKHLLGKKYTNQCLGEETGTYKDFDEEATLGSESKTGFVGVGKEVLGKKNAILIDNMWFIGHFYHISNKRSSCDLSEAAVITESPYLDKKLSNKCPFSEIGCSR